MSKGKFFNSAARNKRRLIRDKAYKHRIRLAERKGIEKGLQAEKEKLTRINAIAKILAAKV